MDIIKIYHSFWRILLLILACVGLVLLSILMLTNSEEIMDVVAACTGIVFFGGCGLNMLYFIMREKLTGKPFLTVTDENLICEGITRTVIHFSDVNSFVVTKYYNQKFISVHYKPDVVRKKHGEVNTLRCIVHKLNRSFFSTTTTDLTAEMLCDLLNKRLDRFKKAKIHMI